MPINAKSVIRVIIEGEWIWVERGTFTLMPLEFVDDNGNTLNPSRDVVHGYFFVSTNGDPYFGPLDAIKLLKLDPQLLEETDSGPAAGSRAHELGTGTGETFGGELGAERPSDAPAEAEEKPKKQEKAVPLFADDIDDSDASDDDVDEDSVDDDVREPAGRKRSGGLF